MQEFIKRKKFDIERSFTNSQIDEKLDLNDLVHKETHKRDLYSRYEGQSVTTNRSFQNLVSHSMQKQSGLQPSNTLYSDRIMATSVNNQHILQNNQYLNSNSSINESSVYESALSSKQGPEIPDIYKSDAKRRATEDGGDFTSNLGEKLKKQKSLPKFFLP